MNTAGLPSERRTPRRQQILEVLASELERTPGERITTAHLAKAAGVSEAALYRHFPSKTRMFEGLLAFAEETVFTRVNRIAAEDDHIVQRCERILGLVLIFAERNPGIARLLAGDVLVGEDERLRARVDQFYNRLETTLKQLLREDVRRELHAFSVVRAQAAARLMLSVVEGHIAHFVRSRFHARPTELWSEEWGALAASLFAGSA